MPPETIAALVLEDEPRFRTLLADVLRGLGITPVLAASADEAFRALAGAAPPVSMLLLDLNLPVIDGMAFFAKFRAARPTAPVVIITGFGDLASAKRAIQLGVCEFITKPCDLGELESAIGRARRQLRDAHSPAQPGATGGEPSGRARSLAEIERDAILVMLRENGGNRSSAARALGISRRALYNKLGEYRTAGHEIPSAS